MSTYYFIHIPKCAGNGMLHIFQNNNIKTQKRFNYLCPGSRHGPSSVPQRGILRRGQCRCRKICYPCPRQIYVLTHHYFPMKKKDTDYIIASIRHPYSWYVSRWSYHIRVGGIEWGKNVHDIEAFQSWLKRYAGLYNIRFEECCKKDGHCIVDFFIRLENLKQDLQKLREKSKLPLTKLTPNILGQRINASPHLKYEKYYTDELKQLVQKKDAQIFKMFDYK